MHGNTANKPAMCDRQTTKKYTTRPGPPYPANKCPPGAKRRGNDGFMYVARSSGRPNVQRWFKTTASKSTRRRSGSKSSKTSPLRLVSKWGPTRARLASESRRRRSVSRRSVSRRRTGSKSGAAVRTRSGSYRSAVAGATFAAAKSTTLPAGRYWFGDVSYGLSRDDYAATMRSSAGGLMKLHGSPLYFYQATAHGDGAFPASNGKTYHVDSGSLGLIAAKYAKGRHLRHGTWHTVRAPLRVSVSGGTFTLSSGGHTVLRVATNVP